MVLDTSLLLKKLLDKFDLIDPIDLVRTQEKIWKENYKSKKLSLTMKLLDLLT